MNTTFLGLMAVGLFAVSAHAHAETRDYCREYQRTVTIGGQAQNSYGTACLQPDGSWKIVGEGEPRVEATVMEQPVIVRQFPVVVYDEPVYVPRRVAYEPLPFWWGVDVSFGDHGGGYRGHHGHGGWRH